MFNSWFHIRAIALQLAQALPGSVIGQVCTFEKNRLLIPIKKSESLQALHLSLQPALPFIYTLTEFKLPRERVLLFKNLSGQMITAVLYHIRDRQILIELDQGRDYLLLQMFGSNGNALHLDPDFIISEAFKFNRNPEVPARTAFTNSSELQLAQSDFQDRFGQSNSGTLSQFLKSLPIPFYSKILKSEICYQTELTIETQISGLDSILQQKLYQRLIEILAEIDENLYYIYTLRPPIFACFHLQQLGSTSHETYNNITFATAEFVKHFFQTESFRKRQNRLHQKVENYLESLTRKCLHQESELKSLPTANQYQQWADLLMAHLPLITGNPNTVTLPDLINPAQQIEISLDPRIRPVDNANRYYAKAKRVEKSWKFLTASLEETQTQLQLSRLILDRLNQSRTIAELQIIEKQLPTAIAQHQQSSDAALRTPYVSFKIDTWEIQVGRSARDNDELTFHLSRPNDFWLHAQHVSGSHVIVCNPQKRATLPRSILEKAAGIAASYSRAKHSKLVPVVYTFRKYVVKPRKSLPGQVNIRFEKTIIVEPYIPKANV